MATHTPGPWEVEIGEGLRHDFAMIRANGHRVAQIYSGGPSVSEVQREANARLIAASPALLEALERVVTAKLIEDLQAGDEHSMTVADAVDWARPVIAQAKEVPAHA